MMTRMFRTTGAIAMSFAALILVATPADARRGGSFGSRGARTWSAPATTNVAPKTVSPMQRSMTDRQASPQASAAQGGMAGAAPASRFGGMAKGMLGGLVAGGLLGMLLGNGFGGLGSGMMMALLQAALLGGLAFVVIRLLRRRANPTPAAAGANSAFAAAGPAPSPFAGNPFTAAQANGMGSSAMGGGAMGAATANPFSAPAQRDLAITGDDKASFERLLTEVQDAFGAEDFARLRAATTPEIMSYLAEELSQNAARGHRNEVTGTTLLEAEVSESWSEGDADYATIAMRYESLDILRDRQTGAVVGGNATAPTTTTELWTFVRDARNPWRLSAIQEA